MSVFEVNTDGPSGKKKHTHTKKRRLKTGAGFSAKNKGK